MSQDHQHRMDQMPPIISLIATTPRLDFLNRVSLRSIGAQVVKPELIVIVSDKREISLGELKGLQSIVPDIPMLSIQNMYSSGAAGSWNTGAEYIKTRYSECYLAILDDDDEWQYNHLNSCLAEAQKHSFDVVLSGINVVNRGKVVSENIPVDISVDDFLIGNPGWQGSNTFIRLTSFLQAGGYSDGLISCNDRDLAIKVLNQNSISIGYTQCPTVQWNINHSADALSAAGSHQKLTGAAQFFNKYSHIMDQKQQEQYFLRMESLFNLDKKQIYKVLQGI